jgi:hypothetical protein
MKTESHTNNAEIPNPATVAAEETRGTKSGTSERYRTGAIARMPKPIRQQVNEMLDDGIPYADLIKRLGDHGADLNEDQVRRWKTGGYQDYLRDQKLLAQCRSRNDRLAEILSSAGQLSGFQATQQIASSHMFEVLADFGPDFLRDTLRQNPMNYFRMLNAFSRLTNGGLKCERMVLEEKQREAELAAAQAASKPKKKGISRATIKEMREKLRMM